MLPASVLKVRVFCVELSTAGNKHSVLDGHHRYLIISIPREDRGLLNNSILWVAGVTK